MNIFKKFSKEESGIGIIEYIILFSLLGTIVVTTTPSIREQVGLIYEEQTRSTDNLNGAMNAKPTDRIDLGSTTQVVRPPSVSIPNEGGSTTTPDPTPDITAPNEQEVTEFVTNTTDIFEPEYEYNKNGYFGTIQLVPGAKTSRVLEQHSEILTKDVSKIITKSTAEEFDNLLSINEEDAEGYKGTITPAGDIQQILVDNNGNETVSKNSGPIIYSVESSETNSTIVNSLFPISYAFEETTTNVENESVKTGYSGTINKSGTPTSTYLGQTTTTDSRNGSKNSDFTNEIEVTASQEDKNHKVISPTKGASSTNPNTYNSIYYYNDGVKEGLLNYVSKGSTLVGATYEYYANYSGPIFTIQPRDNNIPPSTITHTDVDGYSGTLSREDVSISSSLKSIRTTSVPKTVTNHKVYTPGEFASSSNTHTYPATYAYSDVEKYSGNLNFVSKNSEFAYSQREGHRTENQSVTSSSNVFNATIPYNSGGFDGTLNKNGSSFVKSGVYTAADSKTVVDQPASDYNIDGYVGTLSSYVFSGTYTAGDSKTVFKVLTNSINSFPATYNYDEGGYTGTPAKLDAAQQISTEVDVPADTQAVSKVIHKVESNTFAATYSYNQSGYVGTLNKSGTSVKNDKTYTEAATIKGCAQDDYACIDSLQDLAESRPCNCIYVYSQTYVGNATKPAGTTTTYHWEQNYKGLVSKPASDTRVYRFQGTVTKPASDTRIWQQDYSGTVSQLVNYYKHFALYSGTSNKLNYFALYNYNASYSGNISKSITKDVYRYEQTYTGTLSKNVSSFTYEYQREFTGTLFKENTEDVIEYTQTYKGTVQEIQ